LRILSQSYKTAMTTRLPLLDGITASFEASRARLVETILAGLLLCHRRLLLLRGPGLRLLIGASPLPPLSRAGHGSTRQGRVAGIAIGDFSNRRTPQGAACACTRWPAGLRALHGRRRYGWRAGRIVATVINCP